MGIKQLNKYWNKVHPESIEKVHLQTLQNSKVAIDYNLYLYRFLMSDKENTYLISFFNQILKLLKHQIIPVYVFDGKKPEEKKELLQQRSTKKKKIKQKRIEYEELLMKIISYQKMNRNLDIEFEKIKQELMKNIKKCDKQLIYVNQNHIEQSKKLFDLLKIPYIQAENEAEQYCAQLVNNKIVDSCLTDDMDVFPCGASNVLRQFKFNSSYIYKYNLPYFLQYLQISQVQFINLCILLGCDYIKINLRNKYKKIDSIIQFIKDDQIEKNNLDKLTEICSTIDIEKFSKIQQIFINSFEKLNIYNSEQLIKFTNIHHYYNKEILFDIVSTFYKKQNLKINLYPKMNSFFTYVCKINKHKLKKSNFLQ